MDATQPQKGANFVGAHEQRVAATTSDGESRRLPERLWDLLQQHRRRVGDRYHAYTRRAAPLLTAGLITAAGALTGDGHSTAVASNVGRGAVAALGEVGYRNLDADVHLREFASRAAEVISKRPDRADALRFQFIELLDERLAWNGIAWDDDDDDDGDPPPAGAPEIDADFTALILDTLDEAAVVVRDEDGVSEDDADAQAEAEARARYSRALLEAVGVEADSAARQRPILTQLDDSVASALPDSEGDDLRPGL